MRVEYLVQKPHLRRYAELATEFVSRALRSSVLDTLELIVVFDRKSTHEEMASLVRRFCEEVGIVPEKCEEVWSNIIEWHTSDESKWISFGVHALLGNGRGAVLWILRDTRTPSVDSDSLVLFHEIAHHMMLSRGLDTTEQILHALATDSGFAVIFEEIDEMLRQPVPKSPRAKIESKKLKELIEKSKDTFTYEGLQIASIYMSVNYFFLLNTWPYPYPSKFKSLSELYAVTVGPIFDCYVLAAYIWDTINKLKTFRASDRLVSAVDAALNAFSEEKDVSMPSFTAALHSIFVESVRETPKELYLSEPERYSPILYGVIWDDVRKMGFPALDTLTARLDIERAPLYEPYARLVGAL
jgi:hypothetical protein